MKKITFLLILLAIGIFRINAQTRDCGMVAYMENQMNDPEFAQQWHDNQAKFKAQVLNSMNYAQRQSNMPQVIIPVAVHFPDGLESDRNCLEALAQTQIDILNGDYTATNPDANLWDSASSFYPNATHGVANITFCLATQNHPSNTDNDLVEGGPAVTIGYNFGSGGDADPVWGGYMNFLVKDIGSGLLGYSPLGGNISAGQAVVINLGAFGSGGGCPNSSVVPSAPYNLGRTVTHELGHFYNLNHIWGDGGCGVDDGIADTPEADASNGGCPSPGDFPGCVLGEYEMSMNYMDYTNDACMYMFTQGQMNVVDNYITGVLQSQFKPNVTSNCGGSNDPDYSISSNMSSISTCGDSVVFDIDYSTTGGFDSDISLSVNSVPAGVSAELSQTTINSDGSFTLTLSNIDTLPLGDYTIAVKASLIVFDFKELFLTLSIVDSLCDSQGDLTYNTATTGVIFNNINNIDTTPKTAAYSDFTSISTDVNQGSSYDLTVNVNTDGNYQVVSKVWIDWNQNCNFDDPGEEYDMGAVGNVADGPTANSPLAVVVPLTAALGSTTMRVSTKYTDPGLNQYSTACQNGFDGEVEDYSINVQTALSVPENSYGNVSVFPNPNTGTFTLKLQNLTNNKIVVKVYDIRGRSVYEKAFDNAINFNNTIDLGPINTGIYIMKISDGKKTMNKRIVIE